MKILLVAVNSKYIHSNPAVYSLYQYARSYREFITIQEYTINQQRDEILKGIYRQQPDVLCFSCYIWNISLIRDLARELHKVLPQTAIWFGGPEVSYDSRQVMEEQPFLTGIMQGEGEQTFLELVSHYQDATTALSDIQGLIWRRYDGIVQENLKRPPLNISEIPFPYADLKDFENRIIYYESSRGCPFNCSYCLSSIDKQLRFRDLVMVERELQFFLDAQVAQVKFVDRTFNCNAEHALRIWSYLKEHDNGITNFHFEIAADLLDEQAIALLRTMRPGFMQLEIGVQSVNPDTLQAIHRVMDFTKVADRVGRIMQGGNIHQHLDLIAGLPYEDYESFRHSFDTVYALHPQQLQLGFLKVLKGSYIYEHIKEYGGIYQDKEPYEVLATKWLSYDKVLKLKQVEEMVEVYYNSGQFAKSVAAALRFFASPFDFYEKLGEFYEAHGYMGISHTRMRRYEILLEFLDQQGPIDQEYFKELLVFDLYAREKLKKRPDWAADQSAYRQRVQLFYHQEREQYRYLKGYEAYDERQMSKMTHIEVFHYDVMGTFENDPAAFNEAGTMVLFDYQKRDALTYSAACHII